MKLLLKQRILAVYHDFHWVLAATKFLAAKLHSLYVKESESEILERSELGWIFWKGRSWSQTFYLRLRNPGCHTWMMASISLVMVVQSNFCNRDFLIDHKFSMGLRWGEFPGQPITFNLASWKSSSLFQMKDTGQYPGLLLHHLEMPFSYLEWLFSQLHQRICINSSDPQLAYVKLLLKNWNCPRTSFWVPLLAHCNGQDLIAHDSWSNKYAAFSWNKKWLSSENSTLSNFLQSNI